MKTIQNACASIVQQLTNAMPARRAVAQQITLWLLFPIVMVGGLCEVIYTAFLVGADWAGEELDELMED